MITSSAMKNGFTGGLIVDFPNSKKAKKYFLFLMAGHSDEIQKDAQEAIFLPKAREETGHEDEYSFDSDEESEEESGEEQSGDDEMNSGSGEEEEESSD
jgi:hypothetical protein